MSISNPFNKDFKEKNVASRARRVFLIGTKPKLQSKKVYFLAKMELTRSQSINCYHLITNQRTKFLGLDDPRGFEKLRDEFIKSGHEIPYTAIQEDNKKEWIAYGKQQAEEQGLIIEEEKE